MFTGGGLIFTGTFSNCYTSSGLSEPSCRTSSQLDPGFHLTALNPLIRVQ